MLDIFFLSYDEPNADRNWSFLLRRFSYARRIHGVKGIHAAHQKCATQANTENFYVVDADSIVLPSMDFSYTPNDHDKSYTHIWNAINPINRLIYGHGGIKLFNTDQVNATAKEMPIDFSLSVAQVKIMDSVASINRFNTSEINSWRSAFRECAKLTVKDDKESYDRLDTWQDFDKYNKRKSFWRYCLKGARAGAEWALRSGHDPETIGKLINDFDKLKEFYENWNRGPIEPRGRNKKLS